MKMNKFLLGFGAIAALSLAACSSDEPVQGAPENPVNPANDQAFLLVNIAEQNSSSRAGVNYPGQPGDANYQDGYTLGEANVKTCDFYFYDEAGKYVLTSNTIWKDNAGQDLPNIELKGNSVVVLDQVKEKGYPKYMVTVLNKPAGFTPANTLEEMNLKLVNVANDKTTHFPVKFTADNKEYFTMTTTSWADQKSREDATKDAKYYFVNELVEGDFFSSVDAAKEEGKAVKVYVERLAAKVSVKVGMESVDGKTNTFKLELTVAGGDNSEDAADNDAVADTELYVEFLGWGLNATPINSYYMKNIEHKTTEGAWAGNDAEGFLGFVWNHEPYFRSFWGKSWTYTDADDAHYNYFSYDSLDGQFFEKDEVEDGVNKQHPKYTAENTHTADFLNTAGNYDNVTSVLIKARVYDPNAAEGESTDMVLYNGILFKSERFRQYVASVHEFDYYYKDGDSYKLINDELTLEKDAVNKVYVKFTAVAGKTYYKKSANGEFTEATPDADAINAALKATKGEGFNDGHMYYNIPLRHLRDIAKGKDGILERTFEKANLLEGDYGVVRNHYYAVVINSIAKIGTGVWDGEEPIKPDTPKDKEYYLGAQINILSWRIVDNTVDL